jgi:hypothetical protein
MAIIELCAHFDSFNHGAGRLMDSTHWNQIYNYGYHWVICAFLLSALCHGRSHYMVTTLAPKQIKPLIVPTCALPSIWQYLNIERQCSKLPFIPSHILWNWTALIFLDSNLPTYHMLSIHPLAAIPDYVSDTVSISTHPRGRRVHCWILEPFSNRDCCIALLS